MGFKNVESVNAINNAIQNVEKPEIKTDQAAINSVWEQNGESEVQAIQAGYSSKRIQMASSYLEALRDGDKARAQDIMNAYHFTEAELKQAMKEDEKGGSSFWDAVKNFFGKAEYNSSDVKNSKMNDWIADNHKNDKKQ